MKPARSVLVGTALALAVPLLMLQSLNAPGVNAAVTVDQGAASAANKPVYAFGVFGGEGKFLRFDHRVPTRVKGIKGTVVQIATSNSDSYALTAEGKVWAWGAGAEGELGTGRMTRVAGKPVEVHFPAGITISSLPNPMPYDSALAIDSTGHVWGWGYDTFHSICLKRLRIATPQRLPLSGVTMATGAGGHSMYLANGHLYSCGLGSDGELGDGSTKNAQRPAQVTGLPAGFQVVSLQSAWQDSGVLLSDGSYFDWGYNKAGQLGDGLTHNSSVPVQVLLPAPVAAVSQGGSTPRNGQTLALLANGQVWAWGANRAGQLGNGTTHRSTRPLRVHFPHGGKWESVCSGGYSSYAMTVSGQVWAWGGNNYGQLGTGIRRAYQKTPARVRGAMSQLSSTASNVASLSAQQT